MWVYKDARYHQEFRKIRRKQTGNVDAVIHLFLRSRQQVELEMLITFILESIELFKQYGL